MNSQNLNYDHVAAPRTWNTGAHAVARHALTDARGLDSWSQLPPQVSENDSKSTIRQHHQPDRYIDPDSPLLQQSLSPQPTVVPRAPSPPSLRSETNSTPELYGPDRLFGEPSAPPRAYNVRRSAPWPAPEPLVRFDEAQLAMFAADNSARMQGIKDELTLAAGKVTPGVDDTPYIQYAIEALTRDRESDYEQPYAQHYPSGSSNQFSVDYPRQPSRRIYDEEMGYAAVTPPTPAHVDEQYARSDPVTPPREFADLADPPAHPSPPTPALDSKIPTSDQWVPVTKDMRERIDPRGRTYAPLTYKPRMLRPFSMMILMTLCLLMTTALIFSAVYSDRNSGLTPYPGSIYSGQYFVFRILPQLLAAIIVLYAQAVSSTSYRVLPFTALASEDPRQRYLALFQNLYPTSFLWPQLVGPWQFKMFNVAAWLACFTIPLQSSAFTCLFADGNWIWAPVQGVVWTLVALYILLTLSTAVLMVFWFGQWTGLMWDVRSIGELIPLLNRSNTTATYERLGSSGRTSDLKSQLHDRCFDRLGYWRTEDMLTGGIWYSMGSAAPQSSHDAKITQDIMGKRASYDLSVGSHDLAVPTNLGRGRYKYLPWYLRDGPVAAYVAVAGILLLVLLIISFLPQTQLETGFVPLLEARPASGAFSAANFLYSFLPSLLGMVFFLLFQSLDQALRILQPWGELCRPDGSVARKSLLADYAACLPFQATWKAISNGHWRVAAISLMAVLFVLIPIMAGGLFMALTSPDGQVRMYPSMPVFGVLLAFLFLYVGGLSLLMPRRRQFLLPRPVTSLAGIISLCATEELTQDSAFRAVRSRRDLKGRLGVEHGDARDESVWYLGLVPGRDEQRLSVRRLNRFTEKKARSPRSSRSMA